MAATLLGFTGLALPAQTPEPQFIPNWDSALTLRGGGGYKDNVFLSHSGRQGAPFITAAGEFIALRLPVDGPEITLLANADAFHYFTSGEGHNEYSAFLNADARQPLTENLSALVSTYYLFQDQVIDVSTSEDVREPLQTVGHTINVRPALRLDLPHRHWAAAEAVITRQFYESPLDDYWEFGTRLTLGRSYSEKSEISFNYEPVWRTYDTDPALDHQGDPIPGSSRERWRHDLRLAWRHYWDDAQRWRTTAAGGWQLNLEDGGYFNYTRWLASLRMEYRRDPWRVSADARVGDFHYEYQQASETDSDLRHRIDLSCGARIERRLTSRLKAVAAYAFERTFSNDTLETYYVNTVTGTVEWEF